MSKVSKNRKKIYGLELILELFDCDLEILTSPKKIREYIKKISKIVNLELQGSAKIERFRGGGIWGKGYSFLQFLTTSSIAGHFLEKERVVFINIFSCSIFKSGPAVVFTKKFFRARKIRNRLIVH